MTWQMRFQAVVEAWVSRWFLSEGAPGPVAFANPWVPGRGPWRPEPRTARIPEPPFAPFDLARAPRGGARPLRLGGAT